MEYTCPAEMEHRFTSGQTNKEEKHVLADYIKDSQQQALMHIKKGSLLNIQEKTVNIKII